jgi:hypothetical protein
MIAHQDWDRITSLVHWGQYGAQGVRPVIFGKRQRCLQQLSTATGKIAQGRPPGVGLAALESCPFHGGARSALPSPLPGRASRR